MIVFVLGGTRSGKSEVAERIASELGEPVTYVATACPQAADDEFHARISVHRDRRPPSWRTIEEGHDLARAVAEIEGTVLVDALGTWIANARDLEVDVEELCGALTSRRGDAVVVSEEVGLSVLPLNDVARRFVDVLGDCNRALARVADRALFVVAGRVLDLHSM